jgi:hypothetical protein
MLVGIRGTSARPPLCDYRGPVHTVAEGFRLRALYESHAGRTFSLSRLGQKRADLDRAGSTLSIPL